MELADFRPFAPAVPATAVLVSGVRVAGVFMPGVFVTVVRVAARTGRLGLLSAAWFAGVPAALGEGDELLGVVGQRF
ncbi:MAG TPA: hypothetical protein VGR20_10270, partial [Acidimicrobiia bacterium]|nr:hypothetical protein [Acidimicrobiia bacterium]